MPSRSSSVTQTRMERPGSGPRNPIGADSVNGAAIGHHPPQGIEAGRASE